MQQVNGAKALLLGPLNYEVKVDGYTHQPHIDHILPCPQITSDTDNSLSTSTPSHQGNDIMMPLADPKLGEDINDTPEMVILRPCQNRQPPKQLIEEMNLLNM